jgi:two-component system, response regulator FlrC
MRLLIVGTLKGQLTSATKLAMEKGASATHATVADIDGIPAPDGVRLDQARNPPAAAHATLAAETETRALVGRTVADVERDLILETLKHCLGNRTRAADILGISIRTLRNKLNEYTSDGVPVPPPGGGEPRLAG